MARRSGDRGRLAVRVLGERRRRVDAPVDKAQAALLTVTRNRAGTNAGSLLRSATVVVHDSYTAKDPAAHSLSAGTPALARCQDVRASVRSSNWWRAGRRGMCWDRAAMTTSRASTALDPFASVEVSKCYVRTWRRSLGDPDGGADEFTTIGADLHRHPM
jgi:hypothetical protein